MIRIEVLKSLTLLKKFLKGSVIAGAGAPCEMAVLYRGEAVLCSNRGTAGEEKLEQYSPGSLMGEPALAPGARPGAAVVAVTDAIALPIRREDLESLCLIEPQLAYEIIKELSQRLMAVSAAYEEAAGRPWIPSAKPDKPARKPPSPAQPKLPAEQPKQAAPKAGQAAPPRETELPEPVVPAELFPEGHGSYTLTLNNADRTYLMERGYTCPVCGQEFKALQARASRLVSKGTDADMRRRYQGIEPIYYDVVTCPACFYSALNDMFLNPDHPKAAPERLKTLTGLAGLQPHADASSVFAGYYLALLCAGVCFRAHRTAEAKLWMKLMRIYGDCGDARMEAEAAAHALDAYLYLYLNEQNDMEQDQQLCVVIGELYLKMNDLKNAREYFFKAKTNRSGAPALKTHAENRLQVVRELAEKA